MATTWKTSKQGQQRSDPAEAFYGAAKVPDITVTPEFRFSVDHAGSRTPVRITGASWDDQNAILSGSVNLTDITLQPDRVTPHNGDQIFCEVNEGAGFSELWRMRVQQPSLTVSSEQRVFNVVNDLDLLRRSEEVFSYHPNKAHPHGWYGDEIIADVCKRFRVPYHLYRSKRPSKRFHFYRKAAISPLEVIRWVVMKERRVTGRRLVIRFDRGVLYVVPFTRSPGLIALGAHLIDAAYQETMSEQFASAVLVRADNERQSQTYDAKGRLRKKPQKMFAYVTSPESIRQFGFVRRVFFSPDALTTADLRTEAAAFLAAAAKPVRTLTMTHPGIPRLRRGDAIRLGLGQDSLRGQIVYVYEVQNSLNAAGDFTQRTTVIFDDPYIDQRGRKILWKLRQTIDQADKAFPKNLGAGSTLKNDQTPPSDTPFGNIDPPAVPGLVTPPGFGG